MPRTNEHAAGVEGARPYGAPPEGSVMTTQRPQGVGIPYVSDVPFVQSYAERPTCAGLRKDNQSCGAKTRAGFLMCEAHADQEG